MSDLLDYLKLDNICTKLMVTLKTFFDADMICLYFFVFSFKSFLRFNSLLLIS